VDEHLNVRLFPVGYWLRTADAAGRRGAMKGEGEAGGE
jgi:hypothetical protein